MPKIIKRGQVPPEPVYTGACACCGTVAEWRKDETQWFLLRTAFCPHCIHTVIVSPKKPCDLPIPAEVSIPTERSIIGHDTTHTPMRGPFSVFAWRKGK